MKKSRQKQFGIFIAILNNKIGSGQSFRVLLLIPGSFLQPRAPFCCYQTIQTLSFGEKFRHGYLSLNQSTEAAFVSRMRNGWKRLNFFGITKAFRPAIEVRKLRNRVSLFHSQVSPIFIQKLTNWDQIIFPHSYGNQHSLVRQWYFKVLFAKNKS